VYPSAVDNFKRQFAHLEAGGRGQANPHLGQATSLPRERVSEFRSEAAKYLAAQGRSTQHMSGVAAAAAYSSQPAVNHAVYGGHPAAAAAGYGVPPPAYPYGSSVDMEGAVEMLGSSVEKMSMIDAHSGFPTDASGYMHHQGKPPPPTQYPGAPPAAAGYPVNKHLAGAYQQQQQQQQNLIR
jgi:hypothetical protein